MTTSLLITLNVVSGATVVGLLGFAMSRAARLSRQHPVTRAMPARTPSRQTLARSRRDWIPPKLGQPSKPFGL
jgi:hypothetical protein